MGESCNRRSRGFYQHIMVIFLGLIVLRLWTMPVEVLPQAQAQILPNTAAQRLEMIRSMERTNVLLEQIRDHLRTGTTVVELAAEPTAKKPRSRPQAGGR